MPLPHTGRASVWPCRRNTLPSSPGCPTASLGPLEPPVFPRVTNLFSLFCHCCRGLSPPQESAPSLRRGQRMAAAPPPAAPTAPRSPGPVQSRRHPASLMNERRNETISMKHSYCLARARSSGCGWLSQSHLHQVTKCLTTVLGEEQQAGRRKTCPSCAPRTCFPFVSSTAPACLPTLRSSQATVTCPSPGPDCPKSCPGHLGKGRCPEGP